MRKNLFLFSLFALTLLVTTGCYVSMSDGDNETMIGSRIYKGEYVEKTKYRTYTAYVTVYVTNGKITNVDLDDKSMEVTSKEDWAGFPSDYDKNLEAYLKSYENRTVDEIRNYNPKDLPEEDHLDKLTGATGSGDRILQAVKNALATK